MGTWEYLPGYAVVVVDAERDGNLGNYEVEGVRGKSGPQGSDCDVLGRHLCSIAIAVAFARTPRQKESPGVSARAFASLDAFGYSALDRNL